MAASPAPLAAPPSLTLTLTSFQERVLRAPDNVDLFLGGGRDGKSFALAALILRHVEQHAGHAWVLFVRQSFGGMTDFEVTGRHVFGLT